MAKYEIKELPKMHGSEETVLYPKLKHIRMIGDKEFVERMAKEPGGATAAMTENVLSAAASLLSRLLSEGYSVKLKGIGTFKASLGMKKDKQYETEDEKHNARSIKVDKITFKADKSLVSKTDSSCHLERGGVQRIRCVTTTLEERLAIAHNYLNTNPNMTVNDYAAITGLNKTAASRELRKLRSTEGSGITVQGQRPHLIYVKSQE